MIISFYHGTKVVWFTMDVDTWNKIPIRIPLCFFYFSDLIVEKEKSVVLLLANNAAVYCFDKW